MSNNSMFKGFFKSFDDIKKKSNIFENKFWIKREFKKVQKLKKKQSHEINASKDYPLLVATSIIYNKNKNLNIIDYGGGFGSGYLSISKGVVKNNLKYYIVDLPEICKLGKKIFVKDKNIIFLKNIPKINNCNIFHFGSCLQYIDNWKQLLNQTCKLKPRYIIFSDLFAGDIKSFVTVQKFNESKMPFRFYNVNQIINLLKRNGYQLLLRNNYQVHFNGKPSLLPTDKFPKKNRLRFSSNLIFKKS